MIKEGKLICPQCGAELIWKGDYDNDTDADNPTITSIYDCSKCETIVEITIPAK